MNIQVIEALKTARYKVLTDSHDLEQVYRLRYKCYRAEGSIPANKSELMADPFDETENCVHVAVEMDGRILASVRLQSMLSRTWFSSTSTSTPEVLMLWSTSLPTSTRRFA